MGQAREAQKNGVLAGQGGARRLHNKSNSTNSSVLRGRIAPEGPASLTNANISSTLDYSVEETKTATDGAFNKSARQQKKQRVVKTVASQNVQFFQRKEAPPIQILTKQDEKKSGACKKANGNEQAAALITRSCESIKQEYSHPYLLMTPEQNIKKHINSPNLMIPNKVSKPFSWYNKEREGEDGQEECPTNQRLINVLSYINSGDQGSPRVENEVSESENVDEPDMKGIEEGFLGNKVDEMHDGFVGTKADEVQPGRGRVRTSSQVFPIKDLSLKQQLSASLNNTEDLRRVIAQVKAIEFNSLASSSHEHRMMQNEPNKGDTILIKEESVPPQSKTNTKSSDCISLPTEHVPNFNGWQNLEVNSNDMLSKETKCKKKQSAKTRMSNPGAAMSKQKEQSALIIPQALTTSATGNSKELFHKLQTPKRHTTKRKGTQALQSATSSTRHQQQASFTQVAVQATAMNHVAYSSQQSAASKHDESRQLTTRAQNLISQMKQLQQQQRGSKAQIPEQGGTFQSMQQQQQPVTSTKKTTQTPHVQSSQRSDRRSTFQHLKTQQLGSQIASSSQVIGTTKAAAQSTMDRRAKKPSDQDNSFFKKAEVGNNAQRQKSQRAGAGSTSLGTKTKARDLLGISQSSLNTSALFPKSTIANSGSKTSQFKAESQYQQQQSLKQHTIKLVTIPLSKEGERASLKSSSQLLIQKRELTGSSTKRPSRGSFSSQDASTKQVSGKQMAKTAAKQGSMGQKDALKDTSMTFNQSSSLQTSINKGSISLTKPGQVTKSTATGGTSKSRHAYIKLHSHKPLSKELSISQLMQSQSSTRPLSKSSVRDMNSGTFSKSSHTARSQPQSQSGFVTPQSANLKKNIIQHKIPAAYQFS